MPGAAVHQGAGAPRERGQATGVLPVAARSALGDELSPCASDETLTKLPEAGSGGEPTAEGMPSSDSDGSWGAPLPLPGRAGSRSHSQSTTRWQSEPGRGGRADGDQAQLCQTASSESSAWPVRSKRPHLSTGSTVQTVRQGREDGLVEEMVQSQDLGTAMGPTLSIDSMAVEDEVSAPLWLRICGTLPWSQAAALHTCYRSLVLASMALIVCFLVFAAVYAPSGSCEREVCLGYVQIADLALAVGSLVGLLSMQSLASLGILGNSESILVAYARRQDITAAWSAAMRGHNVRLGLLWICSVVLRCVSLLNGSRPTLLDAASTGSYAVVSLVFMGIVGGILHVSCALTMAIDSYVTHFDGLHFRLDTSVYEWNLLQAVLRKVSGAVEKTFLAVQSTAAALVTGVILAGRGLLMAGSLGDLTWLFSAALLVVGVMFIFFKAAEASERCMRMPSLINSLNFGECVDTRRHYLVEFMSYSAAGFYVGEVRLTTAIALKLTYFCCILAFAGLSELYAEDAASF
ncbi:unnamed protein product [Prorocentrum cordatum]|uniref:Solute carrier family 40 protein n=1 Tax=Prorocentrum cordatum TaxID=2364126 RepID=A0ABN9PIV7_9DINO|nr:unnamed protein product [Polarella glacialis]